MTSRTTINLALLALIALLGAIAWFQPGIEPEHAPLALTRLSAADIAKVRIDRISTQGSAFEKREGKWWMTEPIQAPVTDFRMEGVLRIAETASSRHYKVGDIDLVKTGLEQPEIKLSFNAEPPLAFGDTEPIDGQRYVRAGDTIFLIDNSAYYQIVGSYTTFLDTSLIPEGATIEALQLPDLALTHGEKGWIVNPQPENYSADRVNALMDNWRHARALEVRQASGGKSQGSIVITLAKQEQPLRFDILSRTPQLVLVRNDLQLEYHLPDEMAHNLLQLPDNSTPDHTH